MSDDTSMFGAQPEKLDRLLRFGLEAPKAKGDAPAKVSVDMLLEGVGTWVDQYKLVEVLGEGGMGIVYLAQQDKPVTREVALKVIKPGMDSKRVMARFEAEEQALALMEHPHVARVYDAGLTGSGRPYFVMEYVKGIPITKYCDKHKLTVEERLRLFLLVCDAVQHAHQKGIIHRDLKPSNILVSMEGKEAIPKVIDFGVARAVSQQLTERTLYTEQGQLIGTPEYMSPEQADLNSQDIDTRTDIYSLGVVLYELLAGVPPFDPQTFQTAGLEHMRRVISREEPKTPSTRLIKSSVDESTESARRRSMSIRALQRRLHGDLDWITLKAMDKDRTRRYGSAGELAADIQRHLGHEAVLAGPPSTIYKIKKFARRNSALVTGATAVIAVLIVGVVVSAMFAVKADLARIEAQAGADFLNDGVLALIDPFRTPDEEFGRRSLIDTMSENLEEKFTGPPLAEARIRRTLGAAYWSIGGYKLAAPHYEQAIAISQDHLGPEHPTTLACMRGLGFVYVSQSRFREAEQLFEKALEGTHRVPGEEDMETARSMWSLAVVYWYQGRYEKAEPLLDKALEISMRQVGQKDLRTVSVMCQMAFVYWSQGRYKEAEQLSSQALAINLKEERFQHGWTLDLKLQLGFIYWSQGRYEQAEQYIREALEGRRSVFGNEFVNTQMAMYGMGLVYNSQGRYEEAESLFNEALKTAQQVFDNKPHLVVAYALHRLGTGYLSQERYEEAEPKLENALKTMSSFLDKDHPWTLDIISDIGVLRTKQQRYDEAESLLREALDGRQRKLGNDHPDYFESKHELGLLYMAQSQYAEAEPLLQEAFHGRKTKLRPEHPHTLDSLKQLIQLYEAWGKPDKANAWRARLQQKQEVHK